jgi:hypothetical protein
MATGDMDADCMSSRKQGPCWDAGDTRGWGKPQGRVETSAPWTPSLWKISPRHDILKEQVGHHPHAAAAHPPAHQASSPPAHQLLPYRPTRVPPAGPQQECSSTTKHQLQTCLRWRQAGLDAEGVTTELLRLKFYCSWSKVFCCLFFFSMFILFFKCLFLLFTVWLSTISPCWFFSSPLFFLFFFCFFFLLISWFCNVSQCPV